MQSNSVSRVESRAWSSCWEERGDICRQNKWGLEETVGFSTSLEKGAGRQPMRQDIQAGPGLGPGSSPPWPLCNLCFPCSLSFYSNVIHASTHGPKQAGSSLYPLPPSHWVSSSISPEMVLPELAIPWRLLGLRDGSGGGPGFKSPHPL